MIGAREGASGKRVGSRPSECPQMDSGRSRLQDELSRIGAVAEAHPLFGARKRLAVLLGFQHAKLFVQRLQAGFSALLYPLRRAATGIGRTRTPAAFSKASTLRRLSSSNCAVAVCRSLSESLESATSAAEGSAGSSPDVWDDIGAGDPAACAPAARVPGADAPGDAGDVRDASPSDFSSKGMVSAALQAKSPVIEVKHSERWM